MRISVALCTYNGERFLRQQLASIADQERRPDEVIVCDDGSIDATVSILENFAADVRFPVRISRNAQNLGSTKNFEQAIKLCDGDVIALADQDDRWFPGKLAAIAEVFEKSPDVGLVFSDAELIDEQDQPLHGSLWKSVRFGPKLGWLGSMPEGQAPGLSVGHGPGAAPLRGSTPATRSGNFFRQRSKRGDKETAFPRSHAPRGNAVFDAPASSGSGPGRTEEAAGAARTAFPRGAWERGNAERGNQENAVGWLGSMPEGQAPGLSVGHGPGAAPLRGSTPATPPKTAGGTPAPQQSETAFAELLKRPCVTGATMAFRSSYRDLLLPIPAGWIHDEWIALLIAASSPIQAIRRPLMQYRRHSRNQVGITGVTIRERSQRSLARPFAEFGARSEAFGELRKRIAEKLPEAPELLSRIDGKIRHFRTRADLPESRLFRLPAVLRELVTLRYNRYSGTAMSSVRDLLAGSFSAPSR